MGKYSQANLIDEELSLIGSTNFIGKMLHKMNKSSMILLSIEVPLNSYLRAEVFCEDIQDITETPFDQRTLLTLLYEDFLYEAKINPDLKKIFKVLTRLEHESGKTAVLEKKTDSIFKLIHKEQHKELKSLDVRMRRKYALRGEIILADMEDAHPNHGYTIERVLELLYMDFIDAFRKGDNTEVIKKIIKLLDLED
ncbi:hypothetical protein OKW24_005263 [Peribacillus simplex]|uniref:hypothetical protein n=2 Tax=Peribacillus simplex TaxID=1478 RepID=UPI0024E19D0E|nr:hypothetical protein [Peribacillus simplex]MDF9763490.1 hypothetical protein [Peribacillus simplex]